MLKFKSPHFHLSIHERNKKQNLGSNFRHLISIAPSLAYVVLFIRFDAIFADTYELRRKTFQPSDEDKCDGKSLNLTETLYGNLSVSRQLYLIAIKTVSFNILMYKQMYKIETALTMIFRKAVNIYVLHNIRNTYLNTLNDFYVPISTSV